MNAEISQAMGFAMSLINQAREANSAYFAADPYGHEASSKNCNGSCSSPNPGLDVQSSKHSYFWDWVKGWFGSGQGGQPPKCDKPFNTHIECKKIATDGIVWNGVYVQYWESMSGLPCTYFEDCVAPESLPDDGVPPMKWW